MLNLNEAKLPFSEDVRNMVVTWVPEEVEKNVRWLEKKRKKLGEKSKPSLYFSGRQYTPTRSRSPWMTVPPPSPVHLFDQLSSEAIPLLTQMDMLPQDLLKECILAHEKTMTCPEVKIELAKMKKNLPLERTRPDSALSSKMYLTVHRLTLQRPSLRYPEHLRKLQYSLKRAEGSSGTILPSAPALPLCSLMSLGPCSGLSLATVTPNHAENSGDSSFRAASCLVLAREAEYHSGAGHSR